MVITCDPNIKPNLPLTHKTRTKVKNYVKMSSQSKLYGSSWKSLIVLVEKWNNGLFINHCFGI